MKFCTAHLVLLAAFAFLVVFSLGCASTEPDNASVRPWNSPEGWQSGMLGGMNYQHR